MSLPRKSSKRATAASRTTRAARGRPAVSAPRSAVKPASGAASVKAYLAEHPAMVEARLRKLRETISKLAPDASEAISYGIPTFKLHGNLVHYAGYANHIGFYPGGAGIAAFQDELAGYKSAKGSVQFPHDRPLPLALVKKIVKYRLAQNLAKAAQKTGQNTNPKRIGKKRTE